MYKQCKIGCASYTSWVCGHKQHGVFVLCIRFIYWFFCCLKKTKKSRTPNKLCYLCQTKMCSWSCKILWRLHKFKKLSNTFCFISLAWWFLYGFPVTRPESISKHVWLKIHKVDKHSLLWLIIKPVNAGWISTILNNRHFTRSIISCYGWHSFCNMWRDRVPDEAELNGAKRMPVFWI